MADTVDVNGKDVNINKLARKAYRISMNEKPSYGGMAVNPDSTPAPTSMPTRQESINQWKQVLGSGNFMKTPDQISQKSGFANTNDALRASGLPAFVDSSSNKNPTTMNKQQAHSLQTQMAANDPSPTKMSNNAALRESGIPKFAGNSTPPYNNALRQSGIPSFSGNTSNSGYNNDMRQSGIPAFGNTNSSPYSGMHDSGINRYGSSGSGTSRIQTSGTSQLAGARMTSMSGDNFSTPQTPSASKFGGATRFNPLAASGDTVPNWRPSNTSTNTTNTTNTSSTPSTTIPSVPTGTSPSTTSTTSTTTPSTSTSMPSSPTGTTTTTSPSSTSSSSSSYSYTPTPKVNSNYM